LPANYSYGDVPDGQPFYRQNLYHSTPAATNDDALPPITVSINEWMAENTGFLLDPGTSNYDDWFELYNHSDNPAELAGYYLTDDLNNPLQYQIPAGYRVPAHGFLLVWADGKPSANDTNSADLHVNFKLNKDGEAIGLFAPDGSAIDALTFGPQTANVSEGRYPDGGTLRLFMPAPSPKAANILREGVARDSKDPLLRNAYALALLRIRDRAGAEEQLRVLQTRFAASGVAKLLEAEIQLADNKRTEAAATLKQAVQINSELGQAYRLLGTIHAADKRYSEAAAAYQTAIAVGSYDPATFNELAYILATARVEPGLAQQLLRTGAGVRAGSGRAVRRRGGWGLVHHLPLEVRHGPSRYRQQP